LSDDVVRIHYVGSRTSAIMLRVLRAFRDLFARLAYSFVNRGNRNLLAFLIGLAAQTGALILIAPIALLIRGAVYVHKRRPVIHARSIVVEALLRCNANA
jgi:hypothetical protein